MNGMMVIVGVKVYSAISQLFWNRLTFFMLQNVQNGIYRGDDNRIRCPIDI